MVNQIPEKVLKELKSMEAYYENINVTDEEILEKAKTMGCYTCPDANNPDSECVKKYGCAWDLYNLNGDCLMEK